MRIVHHSSREKGCNERSRQGRLGQGFDLRRVARELWGKAFRGSPRRCRGGGSGGKTGTLQIARLILRSRLCGGCHRPCARVSGEFAAKEMAKESARTTPKSLPLGSQKHLRDLTSRNRGSFRCGRGRRDRPWPRGRLRRREAK